MSAQKRLPAVKTLYDMLPKGTEGGTEFARIVDLLLFHEARRSGKNLTIFSDAAGDYFKLDSFEKGFRKYEKVGYQYRFYPSPLSAKHRGEIEKSLKQITGNKTLKIEKWILVTPQDFIESSTRKDGGDVTWFESLPEKLGLKFQIEHWGHKNLLSLFLETPALCLYYYPELIPDGSTRKKTIQDTRKRYNDGINILYRKIEFVGMSVYKEEATRGVPMEDIYIPLTAIPEKADEKTTSRTDPLSFLKRGARIVVLGDPGSGKSTLLKFLALVGNSAPLQTRHNAKPDERLPIFITLRRYADELKTRKNLSLIDYIQEVVQGDFTLNSADVNFFEYYLESGQAILLFDGLDELPNPQFKQIVRDRIRTLITTYPGNTVVVTSRIIGYGSLFRFDEKEFSHYRLARLQLPQIEQFVTDWYNVRIDNERERKTYINDLVRILQSDDYRAIRELAENPLLLTIVVLVHRIDAVLPDERVILYQKCTETLLVTWHTWKYRTEEIKKRGKEERRNRHRIEEIAYWMHCQSMGIEENQRAVVDYEDLKRFLGTYIAEEEKTTDEDNDAEDLAEEFLDFVKKRAGLLMEIGDNRYSFVHLTFQEYLVSSCIKRRGETAGVLSTWETIKGNCGDPRWHEVIRLLVAGLESDESQKILVEKILEETGNNKDAMHSLLLGGLLLDGIMAAEDRQERILYYLLRSATVTREGEELRLILERICAWAGRKKGNEEATTAAFKSLWDDLEDKKEKAALILVAFAMNWPEERIVEVVGRFLYDENEDAELLRLLLCEVSNLVPSPSLKRKLKSFWATKDFLSLKSGFTNFVSAAFQAVSAPLEMSIVAERSFEEQLITLLPSPYYGVSLWHTLISLQLFANRSSEIYRWTLDLDQDQAMDMALTRDQAMDMAMDMAMARDQALNWDLDRTVDWVRDRILDQAHIWALNRILDRAWALDLDREQSSKMILWDTLLATPDLCNPILDLLCYSLALKPRLQWWEALRVRFLPKVPQRVTFYKETTWKQVESSFESEKIGKTEIYMAASLLIFDACLYVYGYHHSKDESIFSRLADITRESDAPPLRIAHCIRDLAYGDSSRTKDFISMVNSDDPEYRKIFNAAYWRP